MTTDRHDPDDHADAPDAADFSSLPSNVELPHAVSTDFVGRTLARVRADRAEIEAEAARVDEIELPREILDAYRVPEISVNFASRCARAIGHDRASRSAAGDESESSVAWAARLHDYGVPPTPDFVERTIEALGEDRPAVARRRQMRALRGGGRTHGLRPVQPTSSDRPRATRARGLALAAVALVAIAGVATWAAGAFSGRAGPIELPNVAVGHDSANAFWGTRLARRAAARRGDLSFVTPDPLLRYASSGDGR